MTLFVKRLLLFGLECENGLPIPLEKLVVLAEAKDFVADPELGAPGQKILSEAQ